MYIKQLLSKIINRIHVHLLNTHLKIVTIFRYAHTTFHFCFLNFACFHSFTLSLLSFSFSPTLPLFSLICCLRACSLIRLLSLSLLLSLLSYCLSLSQVVSLSHALSLSPFQAHFLRSLERHTTPHVKQVLSPTHMCTSTYKD